MTYFLGIMIDYFDFLLFGFAEKLICSLQEVQKAIMLPPDWC